MRLRAPGEARLPKDQHLLTRELKAGAATRRGRACNRVSPELPFEILKRGPLL
jgi:hypothetical protein